MTGLLERLNAWLERNISDAWWQRLDRFNRAVLTAWVIVFAVVGAGIAGWALTRGPAGVLFAIPVALGAYLLLRDGR